MLLGNKVGENGAIYGWELASILTELRQSYNGHINILIIKIAP